MRASTFSGTELFRPPYRTVLLANRIFFDKNFLAYQYDVVRYGTRKSSVREKVDARSIYTMDFLNVLILCIEQEYDYELSAYVKTQGCFIRTRYAQKQ